MGTIYTPESEYAKELGRFEQWPTLLSPTPGNPFRFRAFPRMLYKAARLPNGQAGCFLPTASINDDVAEAFAKRCQLIVHDEAQLQRAVADGWRASVAEALEAFEAQQQAIGDAAAEAAAAAQRMSARAQAEYHAAEAATHEHVPDVPAPKRRPHRRKPSTSVLHVDRGSHD